VCLSKIRKLEVQSKNRRRNLEILPAEKKNVAINYSSHKNRYKWKCTKLLGTKPGDRDVRVWEYKPIAKQNKDNKTSPDLT